VTFRDDNPAERAACRPRRRSQCVGCSPTSARPQGYARRVECQGYIRVDIEIRVTDTKSYAFSNHHRGQVGPGDPVHHMLVRITVDEKLTVVAA